MVGRAGFSAAFFPIFLVDQSERLLRVAARLPALDRMAGGAGNDDDEDEHEHDAPDDLEQAPPLAQFLAQLGIDQEGGHFWKAEN